MLSHPSCPPRIQPQFLLHMALQQESSDRLQPGLRGKRLLQRQQASWTLVCDYGLTSPLIYAFPHLSTHIRFPALLWKQSCLYGPTTWADKDRGAQKPRLGARALLRLRTRTWCHRDSGAVSSLPWELFRGDL